MLYVNFWCTKYKSAGHPDGLFRRDMKDFWLEDERAKKIIKDIDGSTVLYPHVIEHPYFGVHNCYEISAGAKNVLLALFTDLILDASFMGDNCWPSLLEVAKEKDVYVTLEHYPTVPANTVATIVNTGVTVHSDIEFYNEAYYAGEARPCED